MRRHFPYQVCAMTEMQRHPNPDVPFGEYWASIRVNLTRMAALLDLALIASEDGMPGLVRVPHHPLSAARAQC